ENRSPSLPFISLHFRIGEAFIISPHKSLNTSAAIIIFPYSLDFSRDIYYICIIKCDYALWLRTLCVEESIGLAVKHNVMHLVNKK
ncbi:MAG: hypothetical protein J5989_02335, partial [Alistipes sp.]|nr:hypothetical protein [Alistipes sp.]